MNMPISGIDVTFTNNADVRKVFRMAANENVLKIFLVLILEVVGRLIGN